MKPVVLSYQTFVIKDFFFNFKGSFNELLKLVFHACMWIDFISGQIVFCEIVINMSVNICVDKLLTEFTKIFQGSL